MDVLQGGDASLFADEVAEIVGGEAELICAVFDGENTFRLSSLMVEVIIYDLLELSQYVSILNLWRRKLAMIENVAIVEYHLEMVKD